MRPQRRNGRRVCAAARLDACVAVLLTSRVELAAAVGDGVSGAANKFVALRVPDTAAAAGNNPRMLVLRSGLRLELTTLPSPGWLLAF